MPNNVDGTMPLEQVGKIKIFTKKNLIVILSVFFICYSAYTLALGLINPQRQRAMHLGFALVLCFLTYAFDKRNNGSIVGKIINLVLIVFTVVPLGYVFFFNDILASRMFYVVSLKWYEYVFAVMLVIALFEGTRRTIGLALPVIGSLFLLYTFLGHYLPGALQIKTYTFHAICDTVVYTSDGIFGTALGASASYVLLFVLFGAFLERSGVGGYFMDLASKATMKSHGGPAKMSVLASGLLGSISGSAIANVVTTGQITIPLMKKTGYEKHFAAAVEAVSSTGGQIMPPVMGAAVFIMADFIGCPYIEIVKRAVLPAVLYYVAVFFMVHFEALKKNIPLADATKMPSAAYFLKNSYLILPLVLIVALMAIGKSTTLACLCSLALIFLLSWLKPDTHMGIKKLIQSMVAAAKGVLPVATACGCAGVVVACINYTGLGIKISNALIVVARGNLFLLLVLTAISTMILGMGLPTTPAYVVVASLIVPTLKTCGVPVLPAHLFAFYYANIANITPPVALASYTAAGLAEASPMKTGWTAMRLGIVAYIVPFMFVYSPELLLEGSSVIGIIWAAATAICGCVIMAAGIEGYLLRKSNIFESLILIGAALLLIRPGLLTDAISIVAFVVVYFIQKTRLKKETI